uniref:Uncharacterized protein n=1 Tax=Sphaerodactylus townsendi TaxID=933632 RepID=A0ACB8GE94_9SAUR
MQMTSTKTQDVNSQVDDLPKELFYEATDDVPHGLREDKQTTKSLGILQSSQSGASFSHNGYGATSKYYSKYRFESYLQYG